MPLLGHSVSPISVSPTIVGSQQIYLKVMGGPLNPSWAGQGGPGLGDSPRYHLSMAGAVGGV